ncbi:unnamed protein product [Notodromas monacha]|uniref:Uncharacterized protein n=1 Tax=Notodromas monacha TaxID=399045 RepID=A0A7R9GIX8_9CRUS|nr:unnamed protein product [Notodromas monacha]CAG0924283.1 unnamed protein product [Notodromas monacha]
MANPDENMDVVNVFAAAAMVEAEKEEPGNPNGNESNKHEERTVRFPTIATDFMNELEKLSLDSWKRLVECLAVIKNEFLCDRMIEGSQASLNRKKAKLMSVEEEHVKLAQSETTMVTTLNARRRLIEDSNKAETAAMTRLRKAFTAITKVDREHLLRGFTEPTELFLSLNNNDELKNIVHLSMIFRISKFFPISPPNYFANVAAEMGLTHL